MDAPLPLILELLAWVASRPRTYEETMEAWRTSCPRMPVWEDAFDAHLVTISAARTVEVTPEGRRLLARS
jgi:hypothetical protein